MTRSYPRLSDTYAIISVALTVIIMMYSDRFGIYPIMLFYILWLTRIFYKKRFILRPSKELILPMLLIVLCTSSVFWSDYPEATVRAGCEFVSMIVCTVIIARITSTEAFVKGLTLGVMLVLLPTFRHGYYSIDGLFGSKNQVGLIAEIGFFAAISYLFSNAEKMQKLIFSILPLGICVPCLLLSHSESSVSTLVAVLGISITAYFLTRISHRARPFTFMAAIFSIAALAIVGFSLGWQDTLLNAMGKDATLTGRTYLWSEGLRIGSDDPILGHAYAGFWVKGQPQAERYWHEFQIYERTGFHFHNLFVQAFVDLGGVGVCLIALIVLLNCYNSLVYVMKNGTDLTGVFLLGIAFMFFIRAFVEVDFWGPFAIGTLLFFSIAPRLALDYGKQTA